MLERQNGAHTVYNIHPTEVRATPANQTHEHFCSKIWYWSSNSINNDSKVFSQCGPGFVTIGRQFSSDFLVFLQGPSLLSEGIDKLCSEMTKIANKPWKLERVSAYDKERECLPPRRHSRIVKLPQR